MASTLVPISDFYEADFRSNGTGGVHTFTVQFRMKDTYDGNGHELGPGLVNDKRQINRVAKGIAKGFEDSGKPLWDAITVLAIRGRSVQDVVIDLDNT